MNASTPQLQPEISTQISEGPAHFAVIEDYDGRTARVWVSDDFAYTVGDRVRFATALCHFTATIDSYHANVCTLSDIAEITQQ